MDKDFIYLHSCVEGTAESIWEMTDNARQITWKTFRQHVHWTSVRDQFPDYSYRREYLSPIDHKPTIGFHIKDDWAVGFYKSVYRGVPCYYVQHSGIEYIWIKER